MGRFSMSDRVNVFDCALLIRSVPGEDFDSLLFELFDVLENVEILPYDYDLQVKKVGELL